MQTKTKPLFAALVLAIGTSVFAAPSARADNLGEDARIPFVDTGSVRNFHPADDDTVYFQDHRDHWYRAELAGPCFNIQSAIAIGVDTRIGNSLDSSSSLIVDGQRCRIVSLVHSGPPPERDRD